MKIVFGKVKLADFFFDPEFGPVAYQTMRRHPFGIEGELELRGKRGGQPIAIPVRIVKRTYDQVKTSISTIEKQIGQHEKVTLEHGPGEITHLGKCTFVQAVEAKPRRKIAYDTSLEAAGWDVHLMLLFYRLEPGDVGEPGGFGG